MGKQKRARQKFHLASVKARNAENEGENVPSTSTETDANYSSLDWNVPSFDDIFKGIEIDVDKIKKNLSDDAVSVRSIAKSIKNESTKHIKKKDKRKLRHSLFIQRIDSIYKKMKESKTKKGKKEIESGPLDDLFLIKENNEGCSKIVEEKKPTKNQGIMKAKQRKKAMLDDIATFKKVLLNPDFKANPMATISRCVEKKVNEDQL